MPPGTKAQSLDAVAVQADSGNRRFSWLDLASAVLAQIHRLRGSALDGPSMSVKSKTKYDNNPKQADRSQRHWIC